MSKIPKTRAGINRKINKIQEQIRALELESIELSNASLMMSDKYQQYTEEDQTYTVTENRKRIKKTDRVGVIHWKEDFIDGGTGEVVSIERAQIVKRNGTWLV